MTGTRAESGFLRSFARSCVPQTPQARSPGQALREHFGQTRGPPASSAGAPAAVGGAASTTGVGAGGSGPPSAGGALSGATASRETPFAQQERAVSRAYPS